MSDPFIGEIRIFAGNFAPKNWAFCDGQLMSINQNQVLYSLLGTRYGGDGRSTFALPDMRGRAPMHYGAGPGLTPRSLGEKPGTEEVILSVNDIPSHSHQTQAAEDMANTTNPTGKLFANSAVDGFTYKAEKTDNTVVDTAIVGDAGNGQSHSNMMPFLCLNYIISLSGDYPPRT